MAISSQASFEEGSTTIRKEYAASAVEAPDTSNGDDIVSSHDESMSSRKAGLS